MKRSLAILPQALILVLSGLLGFSFYLRPLMQVAIAEGSTLVSGSLQANATWTLASSPYIVMEDIIVESGVFLTIEAGVVVKFFSGTNLVIEGVLIAGGNFTHNIMFTSNSTPPAPGDWGTIRFSHKSEDSISMINWTTVSFATNAITVESSSLWIQNSRIERNVLGLNITQTVDGNYRNLVIQNSLIAENIGREVGGGPSHRETVIASGVRVNGGNVSVRNSRIENNNGSGISTNGLPTNFISLIESIVRNNAEHGVMGPNIYVDRSLIENNTANGLDLWGSLHIVDSVVSDNAGTGIYCKRPSTATILNCNVTGNQKSGILAWGEYMKSVTHIHNNNIFGNTAYDFFASSGAFYAFVNAEYNWWGTTDRNLIDEHIYDNQDDFLKVQVYYIPFLNTPARLRYSLTVDPKFFDNAGTTQIYPSSWIIQFPNATAKAVSSAVAYNLAWFGKYSIVSILYNGAEVLKDGELSIMLISDTLWSPVINCTIPTIHEATLSSSTSPIGFNVEIYGNLTSNNVGLSQCSIYLSYSVTNGETWNDIASVDTDSAGSYEVVWIPLATGNYLVRSMWSGNSIYPSAEVIVNLSVIPFEEQSVFSVASNSTVMNLAFNSTSRELSFVVEGPSGTDGYVNVFVAKTLIENIADVKVYLDGNQLNYTVKSLDDSWSLRLTYRHSIHSIRISLGSAPFSLSQLITQLSLIILGAVIAVAASVTFYKMRKKGTRA